MSEKFSVFTQLNYTHWEFPLNSSTLVYSSMLYRPLFTFHQVLVAFVPLKNPKVPSDKLSMGGRARPSEQLFCYGKPGMSLPIY